MMCTIFFLNISPTTFLQKKVATVGTSDEEVGHVCVRRVLSGCLKYARARPDLSDRP